MTEDPLLKYLVENSRELFKEKLYTYNDLTVRMLGSRLWKVVASNDADFPVGTEFIIGEGNQHKIKEKDER